MSTTISGHVIQVANYTTGAGGTAFLCGSFASSITIEEIAQ